MQELIATEASERIGAGRYERAETRVTDRNGSCARLVATRAGDVELRIPKHDPEWGMLLWLAGVPDFPTGSTTTGRSVNWPDSPSLYPGRPYDPPR